MKNIDKAIQRLNYWRKDIAAKELASFERELLNAGALITDNQILIFSGLKEGLMVEKG